jgi:hypothetical protein
MGGVIMSTLVDAMSLSGVIRGYDGTPIPMINVTLYRDTRVLADVYTSEEGTYEVSVPTGDPMTVRFDAHWSLNNARDWHPSVVANIAAMHDLVLDRWLMRVGMGDSETAAIGALTAYQFCAMWMDGDPNPAYAEYAAFRVSQMKLSTEGRRDVQRILEAHFTHQAHSS